MLQILVETPSPNIHTKVDMLYRLSLMLIHHMIDRRTNLPIHTDKILVHSTLDSLYDIGKRSTDTREAQWESPRDRGS